MELYFGLFYENIEFYQIKCVNLISFGKPKLALSSNRISIESLCTKITFKGMLGAYFLENANPLMIRFLPPKNNSMERLF